MISWSVSFRLYQWYSELVEWHAEKTLMPKSVIAIFLEKTYLIHLRFVFFKFKKCCL